MGLKVGAALTKARIVVRIVKAEEMKCFTFSMMQENIESGLIVEGKDQPQAAKTFCMPSCHVYGDISMLQGVVKDSQGAKPCRRSSTIRLYSGIKTQ